MYKSLVENIFILHRPRPQNGLHRLYSFVAPLRLKNSIMAPARFPITGSTRLFLLDVHIPYINEFSHCLGVCLFFVDYMRYRCR